MASPVELTNEEKDDMTFMWLSLQCEMCKREFEAAPEKLLGAEDPDSEQRLDKWSQEATAKALNKGWTWAAEGIVCHDCG